MQKDCVGILMQKKKISENIAIYFPQRAILGKIVTGIETNGDSSKAFFVDGFNDYQLMEDYKSLSQNDDQVVGYTIKLSDLCQQVEDFDLDDLLVSYYDKFAYSIQLGFYIPEKIENKLIFLPLNIEKLLDDMKESEVTNDGFITLSYKEVINSLLDNDFLDLDYLYTDLEEDLEEIDALMILIDKLAELSPTNLKDNTDNKKINKKIIEINKQMQSICEAIEKILDSIDMNTNTKSVLNEQIKFFKNYYKLENINNEEDKLTILKTLSSVYDINIRTLKDLYSTIISDDDEYSNITKENNKSTQQESEKYEQQDEKNDFLSIQKVKNFCDKRIIGQEEAKIAVISTVFMNRLKGDYRNKKTCLLVGPTGTGKTLIAETVAEYFDVPTVSISTPELTPSGYKGGDIDSFLTSLLIKANGDQEKAEHGIVILDEFEKKNSRDSNSNFGKEVLNSFLPFIQGTLYKVDYYGKKVDFNTHNLTFILAGSCAELLEKKQKEKQKIIGFKTNNDASAKNDEYNITKEEIEEFYNIPQELMGRVLSIVQLKPHTKESAKGMLFDSDISPLITEYDKLKQVNITLSCTNGYIDKLIDKFLTNTHGARALNELIEESIRYSRFEALYANNLFKEVILNEDALVDPSKAILVYKDGNYITAAEAQSKRISANETSKEDSKVKEKIRKIVKIDM